MITLLKLRTLILGLLLLTANSVFPKSKKEPYSDPDVRIDSILQVFYEDYFFIDYDGGIGLLEEARSIASDNGLNELEAYILVNKVWIAQNFGKLSVMKETLDEAAPMIKNLDPTKAGETIGNYSYAKASYLTRLGDTFGAIAEYRNTLDYSGSDSSLTHDTYNSIGYNFLKSGNPVRSIEYYQQALLWIPELPDGSSDIISEALDLQSIGLSYLYYFRLSGDPKLLKYSLDFLSRANKRISQSEYTYRFIANSTSIKTNLAQAFLEDGQPDSAAYYLGLAREYFSEGDPFFFQIHLRQGDLLMYKGNFTEAVSYYKKALQISYEKYEKADLTVIDVYVKLSEAYLASANTSNALKTLQAGLSILEEVKDKISTSSYSNLALPLQTSVTKVLYQIYRANEANVSSDSVYRQFTKTMGIVKEIRKAFPDRTFKEFLSSEAKSLSGIAMEVCYRAYRKNGDSRWLENAYRVSEESKALTLLENTIENEAISYAGIPDSVIEIGDTYRRELVEMEIAIRSGDTINTTIEQKNRQFDEYIQLLESRYPAYYELKYAISIPDTEAIIETLGSNDQLLQYFIGEENAFVISLSDNGKEFVKLESYNKNKVKALLSGLQQNPVDQPHKDPYENYQIAARENFQILMGELSLQKAEKLIIIPDGILHLLPFETLIDIEGEPLIRKYAISYDLSATLMQFKINRETAEFDGKYVGFAPQYNGLKTVEIRGEEEADADEQRLLGNLNYNEEEVESLKRHIGGKVYSGNQATKSNFTELADRYEVFHLSAHGLYNDRSPLNSAVYFSQKEPGAYHEKNILFAYELYERNISARLGVLSSCESGFGAYQSGEGLTGLRRAFNFAGCQSLISSLWNANDKATSSIIGSLGQYLSEGDEKDEALRKAKLKFLDQNEAVYKHPYYWGHLTLSGDRSAIRKSFWLYWTSFLIIAVVAAGVLLIIRSWRS